jgi:hypothetical protein
LSDAAKPLSDVAKVLSDVAKSLSDVAKVLSDVAKPLSDVAKSLSDVAKVLSDVAKVLSDAAKHLSDAALSKKNVQGGFDMSLASRDYIPRREAELVPWAENFCLRAGSYADDLDIPAAEVSALNASLIYYKSLFEQCKGSERTRVLTAKKKAAKDDTVAKIRAMVTFRLQSPQVTDAMRIEMGLRPRDAVRTQHVDVTEIVEFEIRLRSIREILVNFWVKGEKSKAKPAGYEGALLIWDVLDAPPERPESLKRHKMASRTPYAIKFDETERGKTVYVCASWQNQRSNLGRWSEIQSAVVP